MSNSQNKSSEKPPKKPKGREKWTKPVMDRFCQHVARNGGNLSKTCRETGLTLSNLYAILAQPDGESESADYLKKKLKKARELGTIALVDEAIRRGVDGVDSPVYFQGMVAGHVTTYSDSLLQFLIKGQDKSYATSQLQHTNPDGGPIDLSITAKIQVQRDEQAKKNLETILSEIGEDGAEIESS